MILMIKRYDCYTDVSVNEAHKLSFGAFSIQYLGEEIQAFAGVPDIDPRFYFDSILGEIGAIVKAMEEIYSMAEGRLFVYIYSDSRKALDHIKTNKDSGSRYYPLCLRARNLRSQIESRSGYVQLCKIPRKQNARAHRLCYTRSRMHSNVVKATEQDKEKIERVWARALGFI